MSKILLLLVPLCYAQPPAILQEGIRNEASRLPPSLPGGALSPGGRATVEGVRFPARPTVRLRMGARSWTISGTPAGEKRFVWRVPDDVPAGMADLRVANDDGESRNYAVPVAAASGGLYSRNGEGWGPAEVTFDEEHPARPGAAIALPATGSVTAELLVGATRVEARWEAGADGRALVRATLPATVPEGCHVPVRLVYGGGVASNTVTLPIAAQGACRAAGIWPQDPAAGELGLLVAMRLRMRLAMPGEAPVDFVDEEAAFHVFRPMAGLTPLQALPPPGACATFHGLYQNEAGVRQTLLEMLQARLPGRKVDAGPELRFAREGAAQSVRRVPQTGDYFAFLGGERPDFARGALPLFLESGDYRVTAPGGQDLGSFSTGLRMPGDLRARHADVVERRRGFTVQWTGGDPASPTYLVAFSVRHSTTAFGATVCSARPGAHRFTLSAESLANLPETEPASTLPLNLVLVISAVPPRRFTAPGLAHGYTLGFSVSGRSVAFR